MKDTLSSKTILAASIFGALGLLLVVLVPRLLIDSGSSAPPVSMYLTICLGLIWLLGLLVFLVSSIPLRLGNRVTLLFLGYISLIIMAKFAFVPSNAYTQNQNESFINSFGISNYNSPTEYIFPIVIVALIYITVLLVVYLGYRFHTKRQLEMLSAVQKDPSRSRSNKVILWVVLGLFAVPILLGGGILLVFIPLIYFGSYTTYFVGTSVVASLMFALVLGVLSFQEASKRAVLMRDASILATLFWTSLLLLLILHLLWLAYFAAVVALWPFNVTTVNSK